MTITARLENHSSDIVEQVLIHFISGENDHSASVLVISRVQANYEQKMMDVWESIFIPSTPC